MMRCAIALALALSASPAHAFLSPEWFFGFGIGTSNGGGSSAPGLDIECVGDEYFLSPAGSNAAAGTEASPWLTFAYAVPRLNPGDCLMLADAPYDPADPTCAINDCYGGNEPTGRIDVDCNVNANNGTPGNPITIMAKNERQAYIWANGNYAVRISNCSHWQIAGIAATSRDAGTSPRPMISGAFSDNLVIARNLLRHNNRNANESMLTCQDCHDSLFLENEIYEFHRHGIACYDNNFDGWSASNPNGCTGVTFRRNYLNGFGGADIPGGYPSHVNAQDEGDECGAFYWGSGGNRAENNIGESCEGFQSTGGVAGGAPEMHLGNITIDSDFGHYIGDNCPNNWTGVGGLCGSNVPQTTNIIVRDLVAINATWGMFARACDDCTFENLSIFNTRRSFVGNDRVTNRSNDWTARNVLITGTTLNGFQIDHQYSSPKSSWAVDHSISNGGTPYIPAYSDSDGQHTNFSTANPNMGACRVYVPDGSPAKGAGFGGADIGATVLYAYENGELTTKPLWQEDGGFIGCGAVVAGLNDGGQAGGVCTNVHQRLNITPTGSGSGCPLPVGY